MALSPVLQKLLEANAKYYADRREEDDLMEFAPPVKIKIEVELFPGESRTITIKAE